MSWPTAALRDVAKIERSSISPGDIVSGSRYVGLEHIESGGGAVSFGHVTNGDLASSKFRFGPNHILYGKLRPYLAKIVTPEFAGICSTDILPISPGDRVDRRYLLHFLRRPETVDWASSRATGVNLPRLSPSELASLEIPLPPLDEQRRIAAILDNADELRRKRKRTLDLLEGLPQSIFSDMFASVDGELCELKDVVRAGTIVTYGIVQAGPEVTNGVPYIRTGDIVGGEIRKSNLKRTAPDIAAKFNRSRVDAGDIVMSIRATVGTTAVVPAELAGANLTQGTARIAPGEKVTPEYMLALLRSSATQQWLAAQVKGATFLEITLGRLRELPFKVAPLQLQAEFSRKVAKIQQPLATAKQQYDRIYLLFLSLQHRAFTGQL